MKTSRFAAVIVAAVATCSAVLPPGASAQQQQEQPRRQPAPPAAPEALDILQDRPDRQQAPASALGPAYESRAAGIALRPPAGSKEIHRASPEEIVEFINDEKAWSLKVSRVTLSQPLPLTKFFQNTVQRPGVLELTAENVRRENPNAEMLRHDVTNAGSNQVGLLAYRAPVGNQRRLFQQALIQSTEQQYYVLAFTSRGAPKGTDDSAPDPLEKEAVDVFNAVLDTVQLLDRSDIRQDQDQRLFRTRAFYVNLSEAKVKKALLPEQYLRLLRDGKDIGYTYAVEEVTKQGGNVGVRVGVRSRTVPDKGLQVDAESWLFSSLDRRHETFTNVAAVGDGTTRTDYSTEVGYSDVEVSRKVDKDAPPDPKNPKQPAVVTSEDHTLSVTRSTKTRNAPPVTRPLPPWYLPQAFGHLLPRLLPTLEPKGYLFATYVSDQQEVMSRYVDIGRETEVALGGTTHRAIPIKDRIGIEGSVTTHYVTPDGRYLGSVNEDSKITILPSDADAIRKIWSNANLTRPDEPPADNARPAPAPAGRRRDVR